MYLVLTNCKHEHRLSLVLVFSCQKIHDLSYDVSLSLCPEERICLLREKNHYLFVHYNQAVIGISTVPLIRALWSSFQIGNTSEISS